MKRKVLCLSLALLTTVLLTACGTATTSNDSSDVKELQNRIEKLEKENEKLKESSANNDDKDEAEPQASVSNNIDESNAETWGVCGADLTWYYQNGILVIRGTGEMADFPEESPWEDINGKIQKVIVEEGCTYIGRRAFGTTTVYTVKETNYSAHHEVSYESISTVELPDSLISIGNHAFEGCTSLASISIPNKVISIGEGAFFDCIKLNKVEMGNSVELIGVNAFGNCTSLMSINLPDHVKLETFHRSPVSSYDDHVHTEDCYATESFDEDINITWRGKTYPNSVEFAWAYISETKNAN